jgi:hypothetical protein
MIKGEKEEIWEGEKENKIKISERVCDWHMGF